ncbi:AP2-like ethylene-responsive transcription factor PLT2 [Cucumis melo var. makuwa]|uniref:AP2-like ethylene-responsive transcription factor PLT2 n=1 Tax=Cucumis melo var. makuwa TaxID=1194695 RepID=A0A5D3BC19_CUCMM|nr:AP2-like ethylene-responsive transcription factor PLT2 [Cucumis melo var. makuwa]
MGSMNSNNWLSFPLSPTNPSLPPHLQTTTHHSHHFSLGNLENDHNMDIPFQTHEWNLISNQGGGEVPKIADFLGVSKAENETDLIGFNEIHHQSNDTDYLFPITRLVPLHQQQQQQQTLTPPPPSNINLDSSSSSNFDLQDNSNCLQSLTLSMGSGKPSTCETTSTPDNNTTSNNSNNSNNTTLDVTPRRTLDTFGQRTSIYRGVTRHRWTGRYEAHLWDNSGYDKEEKAARAYDLAALKYWGTSTTTNFPISNYEKEVEEMKHMTRQEFVAAIRRKSSGFSRGASMYRGVTRHHQHGRWQARIGRVAGNKDLYLGTFSTEEEAAEAYDIAAIKFRGLNAVTNFDMSRYDVKSILESNTLPIGGGAAKRLKEAQAVESSRKRDEMIALGSSSSSSSCFQYGTSSSSTTNSSHYPNLLQQPNLNIDHHHLQTQPLLSLQNHHDISHYAHHPSSFHNPSSSYIHHSSDHSSYPNNNNNNHPFYGAGYLHNHPALLHGMINMSGGGGGGGGGGASSLDNNNNTNALSHYESNSNGGGGYLGNAFGIGSASGSAAEEYALVKVDYDMPNSGGYGGWTGDSVQGSNAGVFSMWND